MTDKPQPQRWNFGKVTEAREPGAPGQPVMCFKDEQMVVAKIYHRFENRPWNEVRQFIMSLGLIKG